MYLPVKVHSYPAALATLNASFSQATKSRLKRCFRCLFLNFVSIRKHKSSYCCFRKCPFLLQKHLEMAKRHANRGLRRTMSIGPGAGSPAGPKLTVRALFDHSLVLDENQDQVRPKLRWRSVRTRTGSGDVPIECPHRSLGPVGFCPSRWQRPRRDFMSKGVGLFLTICISIKSLKGTTLFFVISVVEVLVIVISAANGR